VNIPIETIIHDPEVRARLATMRPQPKPAASRPKLSPEEETAKRKEYYRRRFQNMTPAQRAAHNARSREFWRKHPEKRKRS
jgi:hypothetical protein